MVGYVLDVAAPHLHHLLSHFTPILVFPQTENFSASYDLLAMSSSVPDNLSQLPEAGGADPVVAQAQAPQMGASFIISSGATSGAVVSSTGDSLARSWEGSQVVLPQDLPVQGPNYRCLDRGQGVLASSKH